MLPIWTERIDEAVGVDDLESSLGASLGDVGGEDGETRANGSGRPRFISWLRRTRTAAVMANVVRTTPIPQLMTTDVLSGSSGLSTLRYASR